MTDTPRRDAEENLKRARQDFARLPTEVPAAVMQAHIARVQTLFLAAGVQALLDVADAIRETTTPAGGEQ